MENILKVIDSITNDRQVKSIINSVNNNQEQSKNWLIDKSKEYFSFFDNPKICVAAGWYGNLANKLKDFTNEKVMSFDKDLNTLLITRAENLLEQQTSNSPVEVIKDYVIKTLPDHVPDIDEIALYLHLSVRSTQRKLQEYGTSYSQLLDVIRKELALTYLLQTSNSVLYVSERLGFSEQSAFQRAFKRWTGLTPRGYRVKSNQQD